MGRRSKGWTMDAVLNLWPRVRAGVIACLTLVSVAPGWAQEPAIRDLRLDTNAVFDHLREARDAARTAAILDLCCLHDRVVFHPRFPKYGMLVSLRARIVSELREVTRELERDGTGSPRHSNASGSGPDAIGGEGRGPSPGEAGLLAEWYARREMRIVGQSVGGPAAWGYQLSGFFAPGDDHGVDLVNLIVQTVNPDRWQTAGGDATINYWQPARVLVVSADMDTHDRLESLLIGLRGR